MFESSANIAFSFPLFCIQIAVGYRIWPKLLFEVSM